ncbi:MAG: hypothetical protein IJ830_01385 [Alphaproteobacteria bacterium]|nr:hypothetical protein [Alphaproteobacteria bacterium]
MSPCHHIHQYSGYVEMVGSTFGSVMILMSFNGNDCTSSIAFFHIPFWHL